jgi:nitrous oxidase accessory protein
VVENNLVEDGRDVVVWYSSRNRLAGNRVLRGRYGTHLMYSHDNVVVGNELLGGVVGVFVMYSRNVTLERNVIAGAGGAAGIGVGLKDAGNVTMRGNRLIADAAGLYIDGSPSQLDEHVRVERNEFRLCDAAVVFHSSGTRNHFIGNHFADNQVQVRAEGNAEARAAEWRGNTWDDYAGYDLDGDGTGDVAYELRSVSGALVARYPELAFFHGSPTLGLADAAARLVPLRAPPLLAVDAAPRVAWEGIDDAD